VLVVMALTNTYVHCVFGQLMSGHPVMTGSTSRYRENRVISSKTPWLLFRVE
jgi:hypothetical protein